MFSEVVAVAVALGAEALVLVAAGIASEVVAAGIAAAGEAVGTAVVVVVVAEQRSP